MFREHPEKLWPWHLAGDKPPAPGPARFHAYERLTALGPRVDVWDGRWWWTVETNGGIKKREPRCRSANQALPWREVP